jgi:hypothetical protein
VVAADNGWQVEKENARRASATAPTQAEAVERATQIVANSGGGRVIVHATDGKVRHTRAVEAATSTTVPRAVTARAALSRAGIKATKDKESSDKATRDSAVGEPAQPAGHRGERSASPQARTDTTITPLAATVSENARYGNGAAVNPVAGEARAGGEHGPEAVGDSSQLANTTPRRREEPVGEEVEDLLDAAARRVAGRVREITERTARPVDQTTEQLFHPLNSGARLLNPLRIAGRTVEWTVSVALRTAGALGSRARRHLP